MNQKFKYSDGTTFQSEEPTAEVVPKTAEHTILETKQDGETPPFLGMTADWDGDMPLTDEDARYIVQVPLIPTVRAYRDRLVEWYQSNSDLTNSEIANLLDNPTVSKEHILGICSALREITECESVTIVGEEP